MIKAEEIRDYVRKWYKFNYLL